MATATKYDILADEVLAGVGGKSNVESVTHCATRLRFQLKNRENADKAQVEATKGVITVVESGGQFQVVIGNTVNRVYESMVERHGVTSGGEVKGGFLARFIDLITSIFTPVLWALAGTGLLKALLAVWAAIDPNTATNSTFAILYAAGDATFQFLPILLAITSARKFKANQFVAVAIAGALIYSSTVAVITDASGTSLTLAAFSDAGGSLTFAGIPVVMISYLSGVIPVIVAVYAQSKFELLMDKVLPETVRNFLSPMITVAVIVPLTFLAIGPVSDWLGGLLSSGVNWAWGLSPLIGGALMGAFWQVFVIFGLHWGFVPVIIQDLSAQGYSLLTGPLFPAVLAQSGAVLAVFLKTRNKDLKEVAGPAAISAFLAGITEPAIYGVTLRLKKPFIYACIAGAIGGAIAAAGNTAAAGFVIPGAITLSAGVGIGNFALLLIGTGVAIVIAFLLTMFLGFDDLPVAETVATDAVVPTGVIELGAPVAGSVVPLNQVSDQVFASGAMGAGLAVIPTDGKAYAPISGQVITALPHAFGIRSPEGVEVLVHVGLNTVELGAAPFTASVKQGQQVSAGDLLTSFDIDAITKAGFDPITIMIVTNPGGYTTVLPIAEGTVAANAKAVDVLS